MTTNLDTCRLNFISVKFRLYVCVTIKRGVAIKYAKAGVVRLEQIHTTHVAERICGLNHHVLSKSPILLYLLV